MAPREPAEVGVKVTLMVQLDPAASELPQVLLWLKSPLSAPVIEIPVIFAVLFPELVRVTVCAELELDTTTLPKSTMLGLMVTVGMNVGNPLILTTKGSEGGQRPLIGHAKTVPSRLAGIMFPAKGWPVRGLIIGSVKELKSPFRSAAVRSAA
jgi:hypothetical protein